MGVSLDESKMMIRRITVIFLFLIIGALAPEVMAVEPSKIENFPGTNEFFDPTGKWSIIWQEATSTHPHGLLLRNVKSGNVKQLMWFNRHVSVMWAPGGNTFAITDYEGSSDSIVWIIRIETPEILINIEDAFIASFGRLNEIYENGHRYFKATNWLDATILQFEVEAYDAHPGKGYEGVFYYKIGGRVSRTLEDLR
jgi:hypothetical protein